MRILHIDIDSLRPDHLGVYGYRRRTSPVIDYVACQAEVFTNCYISDGPCLPSRTALWSGRKGARTGVVGHGGEPAQPFREPDRGFNDSFSLSAWPSLLRAAGFRTASISSFAQRHSAWHCYAGMNDVLDPGGFGSETAERVNARAAEWVRAYARGERWYLHVNYWDPHTPYRTPLSYANPLTGDPLPPWVTQDRLDAMWDSYGPHGAHEPNDFLGRSAGHPRMPDAIRTVQDARAWIDGYDVGVRYMDEHLGHLLDILKSLGVLDDVTIVISSDHGESLGENNIWGDHHLADHVTARIPLIIRRPGSTRRVDDALHYAYDWPASLLSEAGIQIPSNWDGSEMCPSGRPFLVTGHGAWTCSRGVRWDRYLYLRVFHPGLHALPPESLWDVQGDPHQTGDLAEALPGLAAQGRALLSAWTIEMFPEGQIDPLVSVLRGGGPWHVRGMTEAYLHRLRETGRQVAADDLEREERRRVTGVHPVSSPAL